MKISPKLRVTSKRNTFPSFEVTCEETYGKSLMVLLQDKGIPVASSCLGQGVCGRCELDVEDSNTQTKGGKSLSCQLQNFAEDTSLVVDAPYW